MKFKIKLNIIACCLLIFSCHKEQPQAPGSALKSQNYTLALNTARRWFESNHHQQLATNDTSRAAGTPTSVEWAKGSAIWNHQRNFWVFHLPGQPKFQQVNQGYRKLAILQRADGSLVSYILEIIPDALYIQQKSTADTRDFSGRLFIYDDRYQLQGGYVFSRGKPTGQIRSVAVSGNPVQLHTQDFMAVATCSWIDQSFVDAEGVFTVYSERVCSAEITDGIGGGESTPNALGEGNINQGDYLGHAGGGGAAAASAPPPANLPGGTKPGVDPKTMMKCFNNVPDAGAQMKVTIYVQEPQPGTSFNVGLNSVGHVAIGLSKTGSGQSVSQTVGYYPDANGLAKFNAPAKVEDNGGDLNYNVSITYQVSASQFAAITDYVSHPPATYNLLENNCTNFVYYACVAGGINPPGPYSIVGLNGAGGFQQAMTPAGMAESIRDAQGQPNVNTEGGTTPNSKGPCN